MQFNQKTVLGLFDSSQKHFIIPVYQRAYSWEKEQWSSFLNDLQEQMKGENNYFYGNLLLETIKKDVSYEIIDGQQRLTTLTIFVRAILNIISERKKKNKKIFIDIAEKEKIYLKNGGNIKLRLVEYDRACFETIIIDNKEIFKTNTVSQKRILAAKKYFLKELQKENDEDLIKIFEKLESTDLTSIELLGKKDSALMFELENNRGKELTNMEKLKSHFMYQTYVYSNKEETDVNIEYIANMFKAVYLIINDLKKLNEDSILIYHCNAYINGYNYRTLQDIKDYFIKAKDKIQWIRTFISELHTSFSNMKKLEKSNDNYWIDLNDLDVPVFIYAFLIKGYKFFGDDKKKLSLLFHILEIIVFRYKLINSRADLISRINEVLNNFNGDLKSLCDQFENKFNDSWYWSTERVEEYLNGHMFGNSTLHYILWKYEDSIQYKHYKIKKIKIINEQIEHISPQTPPDESPIATGYQIKKNHQYNNSFIREYLNCIGNLLLISDSHNSSIGNIAFSKKLHSYIKNPLIKQQAEIVEYISGTKNNPKWDKIAIDKRHEKIVDFSLKKWDLNSIEVD